MSGRYVLTTSELCINAPEAPTKAQLKADKDRKNWSGFFFFNVASSASESEPNTVAGLAAIGDDMATSEALKGRECKVIGREPMTSEALSKGLKSGRMRVYHWHAEGRDEPYRFIKPGYVDEVDAKNANASKPKARKAAKAKGPKRPLIS